MNILIIHEVDWLKKVSFEIHHLSELLSIRGHSVSAIDVPDPSSLLSKNPSFENYHRIYENASVKLFHTPLIPVKGLNRVSAYLTSYNFIKKIVQEEKIDLVLMYSIVTNAKAAIKVCKEFHIPLIHRTFDIIHDLIRENYLRNKVEKIEKEVYPKFDLVLANTPFMENWAKKMGAKNVVVVPQGVDPSIMIPSPPDTKLMESLGILQTDDVVLSLGSIESFSGVDSLINQIPEILTQIPNFKLLVVGGGSHLSILKEQVKNMNLESKVIFTDYVPYHDVPKYCSIAKLCVNTFQVNDMTIKLSPVKVFDMLSCGKIVVSTPLEGLLYDFPRDSNTVEYENLETFSNKIISLLRNKSSLEQNQGRDFVQQNFTWEKITDNFLKRFKSFSTN